MRNPIDAFILARLEERGLPHSPPADRATVLRRLRFDLTGLPPTPDELDAFLGDHSPLAYEALVDRLLASPQYGERWGQHWLDLARFAETDGFEFDQVRPDAWRYRDWVVRALNSDLPYDDFVRFQLAGDEVRPGDPAAFSATGFSRCYPDMVDLNDQKLRRQNALNDITETTGLVFLGLTIGWRGVTTTSSTRSPRPTSTRFRLSSHRPGSAMTIRCRQFAAAAAKPAASTRRARAPRPRSCCAVVNLARKARKWVLRFRRSSARVLSKRCRLQNRRPVRQVGAQPWPIGCCSPTIRSRPA